MLAQPSTEEPSLAEPRYAHGELLLVAFLSARRPLTFDDLAHVVMDTGARISDVVGWLAGAQTSGIVASDGYEAGPGGEPSGPRRFSLSPRARAELRPRRIGDRRPRHAALHAVAS